MLNLATRSSLFKPVGSECIMLTANKTSCLSLKSKASFLFCGFLSGGDEEGDGSPSKRWATFELIPVCVFYKESLLRPYKYELEQIPLYLLNDSTSGIYRFDAG